MYHGTEEFSSLESESSRSFDKLRLWFSLWLQEQIGYTAEIVLDMVEDGYMGQQFDPVTGINVWKLEG